MLLGIRNISLEFRPDRGRRGEEWLEGRWNTRKGDGEDEQEETRRSSSMLAWGGRDSFIIGKRGARC